MACQLHCSSVFTFLFACLVFLPPCFLFPVSNGVQQATIWTANVFFFSVNKKLFHSLLVLCFLNHECHYHYRWCGILFWSLDPGLCMIKNKIYGTVQSATSVVLAEPAVLPALLLLSSNPTNVNLRHNASNRKIAVTQQFYHPVGEVAHEYLMLLKSTAFAAQKAKWKSWVCINNNSDYVTSWMMQAYQSELTDSVGITPKVDQTLACLLQCSHVSPVLYCIINTLSTLFGHTHQIPPLFSSPL